jgi:hypothetical protein
MQSAAGSAEGTRAAPMPSTATERHATTATGVRARETGERPVSSGRALKGGTTQRSRPRMSPPWPAS